MRFNFQNIGTALAIVISMVALIVSIQEANLLKEQQKVMVWPYLTLGTSYNNKGVEFELSNNGIGPGIVQSVEVRYKGTPYRNWDALMDAILPGHSVDYNVYRVDDFHNDVVKAGDAYRVFYLPWNEETRKMAETIPQWNYKICYCSVIGDCWENVNGEIRAVDKEIRYEVEFEN